jgi:hypothetical protein
MPAFLLAQLKAWLEEGFKDDWNDPVAARLSRREPGPDRGWTHARAPSSPGSKPA